MIFQPLRETFFSSEILVFAAGKSSSAGGEVLATLPSRDDKIRYMPCLSGIRILHTANILVKQVSVQNRYKGIGIVEHAWFTLSTR